MMDSMSERLSARSPEKMKITEVFLPSSNPDGNVGVRTLTPGLTPQTPQLPPFHSIIGYTTVTAGEMLVRCISDLD
ncbi:unnamed protein product [Parnassius apollo]|uniref:(apollo) hypothetical protein n=1 Tax=Parnassius apollo TaxID=110799 RepID=A0A8S3Y4Y0_PARAO|nr:unnamed protein product [Parnassius apollo]